MKLPVCVLIFLLLFDFSLFAFKANIMIGFLPIKFLFFVYKIISILINQTRKWEMRHVTFFWARIDFLLSHPLALFLRFVGSFIVCCFSFLSYKVLFFSCNFKQFLLGNRLGRPRNSLKSLRHPKRTTSPLLTCEFHINVVFGEFFIESFNNFVSWKKKIENISKH